MYKIFTAILCRRRSYYLLSRYLLPVKLAFFLVLATFLQTYGKGYAQRVNITVVNAPLLTVFDKLSEQTGFDFIYNFDIVSKTKPVSLNFHNASLKEVLDHCLLNQALSYRIENTTVVIKNAEKDKASQQGTAVPPVNISGKVTDNSGAPLPGVTIRVKNGTATVVSDVQGNFRISVADPNSILVFSFIGFAPQEVAVAGRQIINVSLKPQSSGLEEVVVVGYGTLREKEVSSAITHISGNELLTTGGNQPLMSLQGKVAGLTITNTSTANPNSTATIQLRGVSSRLQDGLGPLYVIDGVPNGNVDNINQNDIASIDVLKGGAASAIYGTQGSNGVILITTKKGSAEPQTTYSDYFAFDIPNNELHPLSAEEFLAHGRGSDKGARTDWMSAMSRDYAFSHRHYLSVSGGNSKTNYYVSGDYRNAKGIDYRSTKEDYGVRANITHTPENELYTITFRIAPRYLKSNNSEEGWAQGLTLNPTQPIIDPNNPNMYYYVTEGLIDMYNPVEAARTVLSGQTGKYLDWSGSFKLNILHNWDTQVMLSENNTNFFGFGFTPSTNTVAIQTNDSRNSASRNYDVKDWKSFEWTSNYSFNYKKHFARFLGGYSYFYYNNQGFSASNSQFPTNVFTYNNLGTGLYNLEEGQNNVGSYQNDSRLIAFFGRLNYNFNDEVFFAASLRHEGSSKFGLNHKWGDFPALSLAWDLSKRPFVEQFTWIDNLKLRGDYGVTGNQNFGNYLSLDTYAAYGYYKYNGNYYQVYGPSQNTNYELHWEKAINYNFGLDFSLFKRTVSGSINYYIRKNQDLLGNYDVPVPPNVQGSIYANVGSMKNTGLELQLTAAPLRRDNLKYEISFAGATLQNKFLSFSNQIYHGQKYASGAGLPSPGSPGDIQRLEEGRRIGSFYMLKSAGYDTFGRLLVYNKDGDIIPGDLGTDNDKQFVGNGLPKFTGSLGNTLTYKNWDLSVYLRGMLGYKIFNTTAYYIGTPATSSGNVLESAYDGGKYSKLTSSATLNTPSDYFLEPGGFVKLDNVTLGYTYHSHLKYLKSARLYFTGRNITTLTKYTGGDPETVSVNGLWPGVNTYRGFYPTTMQLLAGVQVNF